MEMRAGTIFYLELMPHYISDPLTLTLQKEWDEEEGSYELL